MTARVVSLHTYPIKGCAGVASTSAFLTPAGLAHDRTFMVVDEEGVFRSQREDPLLATIRPEVLDDGRALALAAPGAGEVRVEVDLDGPRRPVEMLGNPYKGIDQGDAVAAWLTGVLGRPSRLVRVPPEHDRTTDGETPGRAGFADSGALLLTSQASWAELDRRIGERRAEPVAMERFRPNVVVDGWSEPHVEDRVRELTIGGADLAFAKLAIRCAVTLVDQRTGRRAGPEPLRTLADYRRISTLGVAFGAKFSVLRTGWLAVGDELVVRRWADPPGGG
ncbi:MAG TPA: MOSC N-terminal beta barrel domain-containing protein [Pseudonocardia sp.]|uniref:MOSC domain-containing protein n=1 Tax=Pseudonocardia sp. TaxID=60912 RepID=UPI002B4B583C|nr:MOSC N-terminal beta barrel domain-containing protein [Pseudonocardia sp.]HLU59210.1 MOSC N-terminal beta barrel domain-containing protein [Pseudonocardia sp.]